MAAFSSKTIARRFALSVTKRLASILLPLGFGLGDFISSAKIAFVDAASDQIKRQGKRVSTSKIAILTGLSRAEVAKIRSCKPDSPPFFGTQRAERVMHGWFTDSKFVDQSGTPLALQKSGVGSFEELARKYSGDMPRRALLDELVAGGMVALNEETIRPLRRHYFFETGRHTPDLESLSIDLDVIFRSSEPAAKSTVTVRSGPHSVKRCR